MMGRNARSALVLLTTVAIVPALARADVIVRDPAEVGPAWQSAWNTWRADEAASLFAQDAVFVHASGDHVTGQPAIAALLKAALAVNRPTIAMLPLVQGRSGKGAWVSGTYRETIAHLSGAPPMRVHGSYLLILQEIDTGRWLIESMTWSETQ